MLLSFSISTLQKSQNENNLIVKLKFYTINQPTEANKGIGLVYYKLSNDRKTTVRDKSD